MTVKRSIVGFTVGGMGAAMLLWALLALVGLPPIAEAQNPAGGQAAQQPTAVLQPVESNAHEFMEYINKPTYQRLKESMAEKPQNDSGWESIRSNALILAEAGNLLLMRPPEQNTQAWNSHASSIREAGSELYQAAQEKDFDAAHKHYVSLLDNCNSCHDQFHAGRPQLMP